MSLKPSQTMIKLLIPALIFLLGGAGANAQSITASQETEKVVQTQGRGKTFEEALSQALVLAIGEVNGIEVQKSSDVTSVVSEYATANKASIQANSDLASRSFDVSVQASGRADASVASETTRTKIGGVIKSFRVLKANNSNEGVMASFSKNSATPWAVDISVAIKVVKAATYNASATSKRLKVATLPLRITGNLSAAVAGPLADQWRRNATNELSQSGRVAVIDREFTGDIFAELAFLERPQVKKDEAARLGNQLGADYVLVATLENANVVSVQRKLQAADRVVEGPPLSSLTISYRVIETATGVVELADTFVRKDAQNAPLAGLVDTAVHTAVNDVLQKLFPLRIERIADGVVYLGQGGKAMEAGMRFDVLRLGEPITDSYTKEVIGREEKNVGTIEVSEVLPTMAKARFIPREGVQPPSSLSDPGALIARKVGAPPSAAKTATAASPKAVGAVQAEPGKPKANAAEKLKKSVEGDY